MKDQRVDQILEQISKSTGIPKRILTRDYSVGWQSVRAGWAEFWFISTRESWSYRIGFFAPVVVLDFVGWLIHYAWRWL